MKIAIYGRLIKDGDEQYIRQLAELFKAHNVGCTVYAPFYELVKKKATLDSDYQTFTTHEDILQQGVELVISLGGDGTLLDTIGLVKNSNIPILGINSGRLGFLTSVGKDNIETAMLEVLNGSYVLDKRNLIHLDSNKNLFAQNNFALNEFTIHKKDASSMIVVHTYLNGEFLTSYFADGLIVSTPTGSTAYNLSCGGPILIPTSDNFVITPVAPHNLNIRPIVVPSNSIISFEIEGRSDQFLCTLDSRVEIIDATCQLAVRKADFTINLVRLHDTHFLDTISKKLNWGKDERN